MENRTSGAVHAGSGRSGNNPAEVAPPAAEQVVAAEAIDEAALNPNGDWSRLVVDQVTYYLPPTARQCFHPLFQAHRQGRTLSDEAIFPQGFEGERRVDKIFSRCRPSAWATDGSRPVGPDPGLRGYYRLNLGHWQGSGGTR
jgi:hypothetical protein